jgi:hypothetical protein
MHAYVISHDVVICATITPPIHGVGVCDMIYMIYMIYMIFICFTLQCIIGFYKSRAGR